MNSPASVCLLALPTELLALIIRFLDGNVCDIASFTRCSRLLYSNLTHALYLPLLERDNGFSLLCIAARTNNTALLLRLLDTFDVAPNTKPPPRASQTPRSRLRSVPPGPPTPLHVAAAHASADVVRILIERGADLHETVNHLRPLHCACSGSWDDIFFSFTLWDKTAGPESPARVETVRTLLQAGADCRDTRGEWKPLQLAIRFGYPEITEMLMEWDEKALRKQVNHTTSRGYSALGLCFLRIKDELQRLRQARAVYAADTQERQRTVIRWIKIGWGLMRTGADLDRELEHFKECWPDKLREELKLWGFDDLYGQEN